VTDKFKQLDFFLTGKFFYAKILKNKFHIERWRDRPFDISATYSFECGANS